MYAAVRAPVQCLPQESRTRRSRCPGPRRRAGAGQRTVHGPRRAENPSPVLSPPATANVPVDWRPVHGEVPVIVSLLRERRPGELRVLLLAPRRRPAM
jgi:hypothetical protein